MLLDLCNGHFSLILKRYNSTPKSKVSLWPAHPRSTKTVTVVLKGAHQLTHSKHQVNSAWVLLNGKGQLVKCIETLRLLSQVIGCQGARRNPAPTNTLS